MKIKPWKFTIDFWGVMIIVSLAIFVTAAVQTRFQTTARLAYAAGYAAAFSAVTNAHKSLDISYACNTVTQAWDYNRCEAVMKKVGEEP